MSPVCDLCYGDMVLIMRPVASLPHLPPQKQVIEGDQVRQAGEAPDGEWVEITCRSMQGGGVGVSVAVLRVHWLHRGWSILKPQELQSNALIGKGRFSELLRSCGYWRGGVY